MASILLGGVGSIFGGPIGGAIGGLLGGLIDNFIFSKRTVTGQIADHSVSSATYGTPICQAYGAVRVPGEVIWSTPLTETDVNAPGGGKGGLTGSKTQVAEYYVDMAVAICKGPITNVLRIFANSHCIFDARDISYDGSTLKSGSPWSPAAGPGIQSNNNYNERQAHVYLGTEDQMPWAGMEADIGVGKVPPFRGIAYVGWKGFNLTNFGNTLPNFTFEIVGKMNASGTSFATDNYLETCTLDYIVSDICESNPGAELASDQIDVSALTTSGARYVTGYAITSPASAAEALQPLQQAYFFDGIESDYILKFKFQTGTSVATLNENDLGARSDKVDADDPKVSCTRAQDPDLPQAIVIRYPLPEITYQIATQSYRRPSVTMNSRKFANFDIPITMLPSDAKAIAETACYLAWVARRQFKFSGPRTMLQFDPGDVVTLVYKNGTISVPIYLQDIAVGADDTFDFTAVGTDDLVYIPGLPPSVPFGSGGGGGTEGNIYSITQYFAYSPPVALTGGKLQVAVGVVEPSGSNYANVWTGADVYVSLDNDNYVLMGRIGSSFVMGLTTADFPANPDPDTTDTLSIDLSESLGVITGGTEADANNDATLAYVGLPDGSDGELVAYSTADNSGPNTYDLVNYIRRGQYNTPIQDAPVGSTFARMNPSTMLMIPYTQSQIGEKLYVKFLSFDQNGDQLSLGDVDPFVYQIIGPPAPPAPTNFNATDQAPNVLLTWDAVPGPITVRYNIRYANASQTDWDNFIPIVENFAGTSYTATTIPPGNWVFAIESVDPVSGITSGIY